MGMHVLLSIDALTYPLTGIGRYTYEIATGLAGRLEANNTLRFVRGARILQELPSVAEQAGQQHQIKRMMQKSEWAVTAYYAYLRYQQKKLLKDYTDSVFHGTNFFVPAFTGRRVATIHDLSMFEFPEYFEKSKIKYLQQRTLYAIQQADALITPSEFIRQEIIQKHHVDDSKIFATPLASSGAFAPMAAQEAQPVLQHYQLEYLAYSLFVSTIEPRKNLQTLLKAYSHLPLSVRQSIPLVVCGYPGWNSTEIHAELLRGAEQGWVKYVGYTPSEHLPSLFAGARLFIFPSWYEGFGLPVLEALSAGVPVISSNQASLPEVLGNAGEYFAPNSVEQLSSILSSRLMDDTWYNEQKQKGFVQAKQFSWKKCVDQTLSVYHTVIQ